MAQSGSSSSNWMWKLALVAVVGGAGFVASNQHWIDISQWPVVGRFATPSASGKTGASGHGPAVDPVDEIELPEEIAAAQYEPEHSPDDQDDEHPLGMDETSTSGVTRAVHEEDADDSLESEFDEEAPPRRISAGGRSDAPASRGDAKSRNRHESEEADDTENAQPFRARKTTRAGTGASAHQVSKTSADAEEDDSDSLLEMSEINGLIEANDYVAAQRALSKWYFARPEERAAIQPKLNKLSQTLYFAPQPHVYDAYVVQAGDQLRTIGKKYNVSWEYLAKLNHVAPSKIRQGQKLKVVPGPFGVVVSLSRFELVVHLDGCYVKHYKVGVGKDGTSPIGTFAVKNKQVDPTYYGPDGVIKNDDPENPLGERWIDIGDSFGIHGTNEPDSIGKAESRGCIRMKNNDVAEVHDFLVVGSKVKIER